MTLEDPRSRLRLDGDVMTPEERAYYASQSTMSDPGERAHLLDAMPSDPAALIAAVSGVVLHPLFVKPLGVTPHPASADDIECRTIGRMLERIVEREEAPLDVRRAPERRFIGICRDYTLLACAALRHHGIPARARVGFATYFTPDFAEDHWVCEYHADRRWRLLDPELGERVREYFKIPFSPTDVPREAFLAGGDAWRSVRRGALDPARCGVSVEGISGAWFVAGNVVRDLAALNKREMLAWDSWGIMREWTRDRPIPETVTARLDTVAALTSSAEPDWKALRETYDDDAALRVPPVVTSKGAQVAVDV